MLKYSNFAGQSSTYNTLTLDGMGFNNGFGVNGSYLGGGSGAQPISLDAIEQIQISIAPYDVRQGGFMGANMNAVTKSGSNEFKGAVYTYVKSPKLQGTKIGNRTEENTYFSFNQYGVSFASFATMLILRMKSCLDSEWFAS